MLCGDEEEHALLLFAWLVALNIDCVILLGRALPEGNRAAYVLAKFRQAHHLSHID